MAQQNLPALQTKSRQPPKDTVRIATERKTTYSFSPTSAKTRPLLLCVSLEGNFSLIPRSCKSEGGGRGGGREGEGEGEEEGEGEGEGEEEERSEGQTDR